MLLSALMHQNIFRSAYKIKWWPDPGGPKVRVALLLARVKVYFGDDKLFLPSRTLGTMSVYREASEVLIHHPYKRKRFNLL